MKANQKTLHRQIQSQFQGKRKIPFVATDHEVSHGRNISWMLRAKQAPEHIRENWIGTSWIVEVAAIGRRDGKAFQATHVFLTSLRTTPDALLQLVRDRWSARCQLRRRVGAPTPLPWQGGGPRFCWGRLAGN